MSENTLNGLAKELAIFADERDWNQFHTPKNLSMALSGEVGELISEFQWMTNEESRDAMNSDSAQQIKDEIADVFIYLVRLADILEIDLFEVATEKMTLNAIKYPAANKDVFDS